MQRWSAAVYKETGRPQTGEEQNCIAKSLRKRCGRNRKNIDTIQQIKKSEACKNGYLFFS
jgi:hypothetical protein